MSDVTQILLQIEQGDTSAAGQLLLLVYEELKSLAAVKLLGEKPGQTLQATALVHDAFIRLVDVERPQNWNSRGHFFAAAAEAMRRILVESARNKQRLKRGGGLVRRAVDPDELPGEVSADPIQVLAIDEALARLAEKSPRKAELVKLRYFLGCSVAEAAGILGIAETTAQDDWSYAKAWLRRQLGRDTKKL